MGSLHRRDYALTTKVSDPGYIALFGEGGGPMLEGLDDVPWGKFQHAYGPAEDVPDLLRRLASGDAEALSDLYGNIWHQGTVYEATAHAVPFLIALASAPQVPERHEILAYLGCLALGNSYLDVHQHMNIFEDERNAPDFDERLAEEMAWVRAAREAVRGGGPAYARLLHDASWEVRAGAAYLLGHFQEDAPRNARWIREVTADEPDEMPRAAYALSVGLLAKESDEAAAWLEGVLADDASRAVRAAAALGLAWARGKQLPDAARRLLTEVAASPGPVKAVFEAFPWEDADVQLYAAQALAGSSADPAQSLPALILSLEQVKPYQSWDIVHAILHLVFGGKPVAPEAKMADLTAIQRDALRAIARSKTFWTGFTETNIVGNAADILDVFGLPNRPAAFRTFVAL
jgi:hypothetical protein